MTFISFAFCHELPMWMWKILAETGGIAVMVRG